MVELCHCCPRQTRFQQPEVLLRIIFAGFHVRAIFQAPTEPDQATLAVQLKPKQCNAIINQEIRYLIKFSFCCGFLEKRRRNRNPKRSVIRRTLLPNQFLISKVH